MKTGRLEQVLNNAFDNDRLVTVITAAKKLLELKPEDATLWLKLGTALSRMSRQEEATEALYKAIEYLPYDRRYLAYIPMGDLYKYQYNFKEACDWYQKIIDSKPHDATGYIYKGGACARHGNLIEAEGLHRHATECAEGCIDEAYYNLGLVLRAQDKLTESRACFEKAIELDPDYKAAKLQLVDVTEALSIMD